MANYTLSLQFPLTFYWSKETAVTSNVNDYREGQSYHMPGKKEK